MLFVNGRQNVMKIDIENKSWKVWQNVKNSLLYYTNVIEKSQKVCNVLVFEWLENRRQFSTFLSQVYFSFFSSTSTHLPLPYRSVLLGILDLFL